MGDPDPVMDSNPVWLPRPGCGPGPAACRPIEWSADSESWDTSEPDARRYLQDPWILRSSTNPISVHHLILCWNPAEIKEATLLPGVPVEPSERSSFPSHCGGGGSARGDANPAGPSPMLEGMWQRGCRRGHALSGWFPKGTRVRHSGPRRSILWERSEGTGVRGGGRDRKTRADTRNMSTGLWQQDSGNLRVM